MYTITTYAPVKTAVLDEVAYSMRIAVTSADEDLFPPKVFVFHAEQPSDPDTRAWYEAIASPSQLEELPEDTPEAPGSGDIQNPYFRLNEMTVVERHPSLLQTFLEEVEEELALLHANLDVLNDWGSSPTETITIP